MTNTSDQSDIQSRVIWLGFTLTLIALPISSAHLLPSIDLPQHLAQVRLMDELMGLQPATVDLSAVRMQPLAAHTVIYWPMWLLSRLFSIRLTGHIFMYLTLASIAASLHYLAYRQRLHPVRSTLASLFVFGAPTYWGLLNFLCGMPAFILFLERMLRPPGEVQGRRADKLWLLALGLVMYGTHVFWLLGAAPLGLLLMRWQRYPARLMASRLLMLLPAMLAIAAWYPGLLEARSQTPIYLGAKYLVSIGDRLSWTWFTVALMGGLKGPWEPAAIAIILLMAALSLSLGRRGGGRCHQGVLLAASLVFLFSLLAPDSYLNTILLNRRFMPLAGALFILAIPLERVRGMRVAVASLTTLFALVTAIVWTLINEEEFSGLRTALDASDGPRKIAGLDVRKDSIYLLQRPFIQLQGYFQAAHGGELNFSFTEHYSSLVTQVGPRQLSWSRGLEWHASLLQARDVAFFDCFLLHAEEQAHGEFDARWGLQTTQSSGYIRLHCKP